jgi:hypothetical protein
VYRIQEELGVKLTNLEVACVYYPYLASKMLEVREHIEGTSHYAFLQARDPITVLGEPEAHWQRILNTLQWKLVAGGRADSRGTRGRNESVRLATLKSLQELVEKQGVSKKVWAQWDGSRILNQERRRV